MSKKEIDVLIICALKDEYDSLLKVQDNYNSEWELSNLAPDYIASETQLQTINGHKISVLATWLSYMGRETAQSISTKLIHDLNPKLIAMCGICAGYRGKVSLGDVIFANKLYSYDSGKTVVEDGNKVFKLDPLPYKPTYNMVQYMQNISTILEKDENEWVKQRPLYSLEFQENWVLKQLNENKVPSNEVMFDEYCPDWTQVLGRLLKKGLVKESLKLTSKGKEYIEQLTLYHPRELPNDKAFQIHVAPILTGAQVQEDENLFNQLSSNERKVLGIDMEASGLGSVSEIYKIPSVVVKGVSDYGDTFKDDRYREFAAYASAYALITYLRHYYDRITDNKASGNLIQVNSSNLVFDSKVTDDGIFAELVDLYETNDDISMLWEKAGGKKSALEIRHLPKDSWFVLWNKVKKGTQVTVKDLLQAVYQDYPNNVRIRNYIQNL